MSIEIEESYASDDSCKVKFWCRGHYSWGEFQNAVWDHIERQERDIPYWAVVQAPVKQLYQRAVPDRDSIVNETRYVHSEVKGRGAYPITLMDFWFPLHAYKPRKPNDQAQGRARMSEANDGLLLERVTGPSDRDYLRTVAELQELARKCPHVSQDWVLTVASMDVADMRRRLIRSNDWHGHFAHSLDGIPEIRNMPGAAPDGCWSHKEVRAVVLGLLQRSEVGP